MKFSNCQLVAARPEKSAANRILWADIFKGIMIFFIAWGHALGVETMSSGAIIKYLYSFHVPAFFFISGYLFGTRSVPFGKFVLGKCKTLMIPYYIFSLISIAVFAVLGSVASAGLAVGVKSTDILPNIFGMLYANGATGYMKWNLPLWFIPCLFCASIIFYAIKVLITKFDKVMGTHTVNCVILALSLILATLNYYFFRISKLPFGIEAVIYMLPFFIVGYWHKISFDIGKIRASLRIIIGIVCIVAGGVLATSTQNRVDYVSSSYHNIFAFYISAFLTIIGYVMVVQSVNLKWLSYVGRNTLAILLMHKFPIILLQMLLTTYIVKSSILGICITFLIAVVSCTMSLFAGEIIMRLFPFALGRKRKKNIVNKEAEKYENHL